MRTCVRICEYARVYVCVCAPCVYVRVRRVCMCVCVKQLLGGEVYHYHTKLMAKDPRGVGGKHLWHQDYG